MAIFVPRLQRSLGTCIAAGDVVLFDNNVLSRAEDERSTEHALLNRLPVHLRFVPMSAVLEFAIVRDQTHANRRLGRIEDWFGPNRVPLTDAAEWIDTNLAPSTRHRLGGGGLGDAYFLASALVLQRLVPDRSIAIASRNARDLDGPDFAFVSDFLEPAQRLVAAPNS